MIYKNGKVRAMIVGSKSPDVTSLMATLQDHFGLETFLAQNTRDAMSQGYGIQPDLVIVDHVPGSVDGLRFCSWLKSTIRTEPPYLILLVDGVAREAKVEALALGIDDYLEKPFHLEDLQRRVEQALKGPESHSEGRQSARERCDAGVVALKARSWEPAQEAFQQALRADPFSACAHYGLAQALKGKGDLFSAMSEFERAVELRPGMFSALRTLAGLYLSKGFRRKAIETLERALRVAPDSPTQETLKRDLMQLLT